MKTILAFGKAIAGVVIVVISLIVIVQFIPTPTQGLSPGSPNNAYPPPTTVTVTSARTSTPVPYPTPGTVTPTRVISLIPEGTSPRPNGYPTDMPWPLPTPSNATKIPMPTPIPTIYPTRAFPDAPKGTIPSSLRKLWYVYASDSNSRPIFQTEQIDDAVQRWGKGQLTIDIRLEQGEPGVILNNLFPSPDGKWMIAMIARDVSSQPFLINMDNGKVERILPESSFVQFLGWKPDSQKVMVFKYFTDPYNAGEVDLKTSEYHAIEFPRYRGDLPVVDALAFSPDGKWMADALVYPRNPQEGKDYLLSIGIRDTQTQERKTIQETPFLKGIWADSLVWSADGQFLSWMTYKDLKTGWLPTNIQSELWINDRSAGKSKSIAVFEGNIGNARLSVWSPDSNKIAVVLVDDKDSSYLAGNIFLIDPLSGTRTQVSHFNQLRVSKLLWSGDSQWIFCNVSDEVSGAIWAVNVKSGNSFPVAGPVIKNSPFTILP